MKRRTLTRDVTSRLGAEVNARPKVYIAGPMTGIPEFNFPAFHAAAKAWREVGWDAINPADAFDGDTTRQYRDYVAADMAVLRQCDAIALLPGWDGPNARGSVWEREIARSLLHIPVFDAADPVWPEYVKLNPRTPLSVLPRDPEAK